MAKKKVEVEMETDELAGIQTMEATSDFEQPIIDDVDQIPLMSSSEWSDYVMKQFIPSELVDGRPRVAGLRRVTELVLGPIIASCGDVELLNDKTVLGHHNIVIRFGGPDEITGICDDRKFQEAASVSPHNCDTEFLRWAVETASTRAEARALRKALKLASGVISNEEVAPPMEDLIVDNLDEPLTTGQKNFILNLCKRNQIDPDKYINSGENQYASIDDVPHQRAVKMIAYLSELQRNQDKIPEKIKISQ